VIKDYAFSILVVGWNGQHDIAEHAGATNHGLHQPVMGFSMIFLSDYDYFGIQEMLGLPFSPALPTNQPRHCMNHPRSIVVNGSSEWLCLVCPVAYWPGRKDCAIVLPDRLPELYHPVPAVHQVVMDWAKSEPQQWDGSDEEQYPIPSDYDASRY
jgi:hypothetical protein